MIKPSFVLNGFDVGMVAVLAIISAFGSDAFAIINDPNDGYNAVRHTNSAVGMDA